MAALNPPRCRCTVQGGSVYWSQCPRHDPRDPGYRAPWQMPPAAAIALVAEVRRLREGRDAIALMDWPGEARRLQAALNFARGTIHDLSITVERLEAEAG